MNCRKFHQDLSAFIDGELEPVIAAAMTRHSKECAHCRDELVRITKLNRNVKTISHVAPRDLSAKVKARISDFQERGKAPLMVPTASRSVLLAAVIVLALGMGNFAGRSMEAIVAAHPPESSLEIVLSDSGSSLADVVMDLEQEGNGQ